MADRDEALRLARAVISGTGLTIGGHTSRADGAKLLARALLEAEDEIDRVVGDCNELCEGKRRWRAQVTTLTAERDEALRALGAAHADLVRVECEADRLRHGGPIEGDFVCPDSLALSEARREVERMRAERDTAVKHADGAHAWKVAAADTLRRLRVLADAAVAMRERHEGCGSVTPCGECFRCEFDRAVDEHIRLDAAESEAKR